VPPAWLLLRTRYVPRWGVRACMCAGVCVRACALVRCVW